PGDIKQRNVMFRSSAVLQNASLEAVPEIARFLKVTPSVIPALQSNHEQSVQIQATIPVGTPSSNYDGTIQVREQSATIPQTLKVLIKIGVPPNPGAAGNATLAGIDSDGDGVRDDVQRY